MMNKDRSLKDVLMKILKEYNFEDGPLFNLSSKLRLHSSLVDQSPFLDNGDLDKDYIQATVEKASDIFRHLDFNGDMLLVYDNLFNSNPEKELKFIESILVNLKRKDEYSYEYFCEDDQELLKTTRRVYQVQGFIMEELFRQISLSDFAGDYDLASSVYIIDIKSKTIFYLYDDRGLYIMASQEKILNDLWETLPNYFFRDCHDFEITIKDFYWIDPSEDNKEELSLYGDLEIRLNQETIKSFPPLDSTGLKLLRSLFQDHQDTREDCLFPCTGNHKSLNWSILHKDGLVTVKANESMETTYYYLQYKREVLGFIKEVEDFYKKSDKNTLSKDKVKRKEYLAFWKEWNSLKEKATL